MRVTHRSHPCTCDARRLDLLSAPSLVRLAHVGRRLNRRNELEHDVSDTNDTDNGGSNLAQNGVVEQDTADEDVD